jgi:hypothetical protein
MIVSELFFRILNFFIVFILFSYIFKNHIYPLAKQQLYYYFSSLKNLKDLILVARRRQQALDKDFIEQKREAKLLLERVKKWNAVIVHKKDKYDYEIEMRLRAIKHLRERQEAHFTQSVTNKLLIPRAFEKAALDLQSEYRQNEKKAEHVLGTVMACIKDK